MLFFNAVRRYVLIYPVPKYEMIMKSIYGVITQIQHNAPSKAQPNTKNIY